MSPIFFFQEWSIVERSRFSDPCEMGIARERKGENRNVQTLTPNIGMSMQIARIGSCTTVRQVADQVGVSEEDVVRFEMGHEVPPFDVMEKIERMLGIQVVPNRGSWR